MIRIIMASFATYAGDRAWHKRRLCAEILLIFILGVFGRGVVNSTLPTLSIVISVLAGFSFSALFSEISTKTTDLPKPNNESERIDIVTLGKLSSHFRIRMKAFILLAMLQLLLMVLLSIDLNIRGWIPNNRYYHNAMQEYAGALTALLMAKTITFDFLSAVVLGIFVEWIYLFYRMAETTLAILDIRVSYIELHSPEP